MAAPAISLIVNFASNASGFMKGSREVNKQLSMLDSLYNQLSDSGKNSFKDVKNSVVDASKVLKAMRIENIGGMELAIGKMASNATKNFAEVGSAGANFLQANNIIKYGAALESLNNSLRGMLIADEQHAQNFNKNLTELGQQSPKNFMQFSKSIEQFQRGIEDFNPVVASRIVNLMNELQTTKAPERVAEITKQINAMVATQDKVNKMTQSLKQFSQSLVARAASAIGFASIVGDTLKAQDQIYKSVAKMGTNLTQSFKNTTVGAQDWNKSFYDTTKQVEQSVIRVARTTAIKFHDAAEAMNELISQRIPTKSIDELADLTTTTVQLSQAFGMSQAEASVFASDLIRIGKVGKQGFDEAAQSLAELQANFGLTGMEAKDVTAQTSRMIREIRAYGGSVKNVGQMTKEIGKLQIAFKKVGLEASDANEIIDNLMNPDNVDQLLSKAAMAGISAADAMKAAATGNVDMLQKIEMGAVNAVKNVAAGAGDAQYLVAGMLGKDLNVSRKLMSATEAGQKSATEGLGEQTVATNIAAQAEANRLSTMEQMNKLWNQTSLVLAEQIIPVLDTLTKVLKQVIDWFTGVINKIHGMGKVAQFAFAFMIMEVLSFGRTIGTVVGAVKTGLGAITGGAGLFGKSLVGAAGQGKKAIDDLNKPISSITDKIKNMGAKLKGAFSGSRKIPDAAGEMSRQPLPRHPEGAKDAAGLPIGGRIRSRTGAAESIADAPKTSKLPKTTKQMGDAGSTAGKAAGGLAKFADAMLKIGAAVLMIGVGIGILILSISVLANAMKGMTNDQMFGLAVVLAIVMAGIIGLALVAKNSATDMIAFGAGVLMMGAGIALIVLSLSVLAKTIDSLNEPIKTMIIAGAAVVAVILAIGLAARIAGGGAIAFGTGILSMGAGIALVVGSIALLVLAFSQLIQTTNAMSWEQLGKLAAVLAAISLAIALAFVPAIAALGGVSAAVAPGLFALAAVFATVGLAAMGIGIGINLAAKGISLLFQSIMAIGANLGQFMAGLLGVGAAIVVFAAIIIASSVIIAGSSITLASLGLALLAVGGGAILAGVGLMSVGLGIQIMAKGLGMLTKEMWPAIGQLGVMMTIITVAGLAASLASVGFLVLGGAFLMISAGVLALGAGLKLISTSFKDLAGLGSGLKASLIESGSALKAFMTAVDAGQLRKFFAAFAESPGAAKAVGSLIDGLSKLFESVSKIKDPALISALSSSMSAITSAMGDALGTLGDKQIGNIKDVGTAFKGMGEGIASVIGSMDKFISAAGDTNKMAAAMQAIGPMLTATFESTGSTIDKMGNMSGKQLQGVGPAFQGIGSGIGSVLGPLSDFIGKMDSLSKKTPNEMKALTDNITSVMTTVFDATKILINSLGSMDPKNLEKLGPAFEGFGKGLTSVLDSVVKIQSIASDAKMMTALSTNIDMIVAHLKTINSVFKDFSNGIGPDAEKSGKAFLDFGTGLKTIVDAMVTYISATKDLKAGSTPMADLSTQLDAIAPMMQRFADSTKNLDMTTLTSSLKNLGEALSVSSKGISDLYNNLKNVGPMQEMITSFGANLTQLVNVLSSVGTTSVTNSNDFVKSLNAFFETINSGQSSTKTLVENITSLISQINNLPVAQMSNLDVLLYSISGSADLASQSIVKMAGAVSQLSGAMKGLNLIQLGALAMSGIGNVLNKAPAAPTANLGSTGSSSASISSTPQSDVFSKMQISSDKIADNTFNMYQTQKETNTILREVRDGISKIKPTQVTVQAGGTITQNNSMAATGAGALTGRRP